MKITIATTKKGTHEHFELYVNGAHSGSLVMRNEEFQEFLDILEKGKGKTFNQLEVRRYGNEESKETT